MALSMHKYTKAASRRLLFLLFFFVMSLFRDTVITLFPVNPFEQLVNPSDGGVEPPI